MLETEISPVDVIIVGGGLSGLVAARELQRTQKTWKLLEAHQRLGGRLQNDRVSDQIDLGGAWIWPDHQPLIQELVTSLGIQTFLQPGDYSSTRIVGGAIEIVNKIVEQLTPDSPSTGFSNSCIETEFPVALCKRRQKDGTIEVEDISGRTLYTKYLIIAAPPKIVHQKIRFDPPLSSWKVRSMSESQTWMAGVTKVALVYETPRFWPVHESNRGLAAGSNKPAFQVYDASPWNSSLSALTFFTLSSLSTDGDNDEVLANQCIQQFCDSLSTNTTRDNPNIADSLKDYDRVHVKRWPREEYISNDSNPSRINPHPQPTSMLAKDEWDGQLYFAGTETDQRSPGVMEGAVGAALRVMTSLNKKWLEYDQT